MATKSDWIQGPWPGKVLVSPRPRGGDWLQDEIEGWRRAGIDTVVSLLTPGEDADLGLSEERTLVEASGMHFISLPIRDMQVPDSETELAALLERLNARLSAGKNALIHCRQGLGRAGLVAACLLTTKGVESEKAIETVSRARGASIPETNEQRAWIRHFAGIPAPGRAR